MNINSQRLKISFSNNFITFVSFLKVPSPKKNSTVKHQKNLSYLSAL